MVNVTGKPKCKPQNQPLQWGQRQNHQELVLQGQDRQMVDGVMNYQLASGISFLGS